MPETAGPTARHVAQVRLLGTVAAVDADGEPLPLPAGRARLLLLALALRPGRPVGRARLVDLLWPTDPPTTADNAVQVYVRTLRRALGDAAVRTEAEGYLLAPEVEVDVAAVERLVAVAADAARGGEWDRAADVLGRALDRWQGPLGGDVGDLPWLLAERSRLDVAREQAVLDRLDALVRAGRAQQALPQLVPLAREHPLVERVQALHVRALAGAGRREQALTAYAAARRALADELGLDPGEDLAAAHAEALASGVRRDRTRRPGALPGPGRPLLGREDDVAAVTSMLRGADRLVTVTGPGGVGKTRLAIAVGHALDTAFADGAVWVPLSELDDARDVPAAIGAALGLQLSGPVTVDALADHLRRRELLLVLDNHEHVADAVPDVVALLRAAPDVRVLVTSRVLLRADGERAHVLAPLAVPAPRGQDRPAGPAEQLLRARLRDLGADRDDGREAAREICRALDGLPLALELAAARATTMPLEAIAAALRERPADLAASGPATADRIGASLPLRQRSLRDTVAWSASLLSPDALTVLGRLSVFRGGCTEQAALAVADHDGRLGARAWSALAELLDAHLLLRSGPSGPVGPVGLVGAAGADREQRLGMLVMVREYAAGLLDPQETTALRRVHARCSADATLAVFGDVPRACVTFAQLRRLVEELDNLRAAAAFAVDEDDHVLLADLIAATGPVTVAGHQLGTFRTLARRVDVTRLDDRRRCDVELWISRTGRNVGDIDGAEAGARRALAAARACGDPTRQAYCEVNLAVQLAGAGSPDDGTLDALRRRLLAGDPAAKEADVWWLLAAAYAGRGDTVTNEDLGRRALEVAADRGQDMAGLTVAGMLVDTVTWHGRPTEAVRLLDPWEFEGVEDLLPLHTAYHSRARAIAARLVEDDDLWRSDLLLEARCAERVDDLLAHVSLVQVATVAAADLGRWEDAVRMHAGYDRCVAPFGEAVAVADSATLVTRPMLAEAARRLTTHVHARARTEGEALDVADLLRLAVSTVEDLAARR